MYNYDRRRIQKIGGTVQRGHSIRSTSRHRQDDIALAVEPIVDYTKRAYSGNCSVQDFRTQYATKERTFAITIWCYQRWGRYSTWFWCKIMTTQDFEALASKYGLMVDFVKELHDKVVDKENFVRAVRMFAVANTTNRERTYQCGGTPASGRKEYVGFP